MFSGDIKVFYVVWLICTVLAAAASVAAVKWKQAWVLLGVAGLMWSVVGLSSANVEFVVTYSTSDYLKDFSYPFLVMFYGLLGAVHLILFGYKGYVYADQEGWLS